MVLRKRFPLCSLCNEPIELTAAKTDEHGMPIHEDCYVRKIILSDNLPEKQPAASSPPPGQASA